MHLEFSHFAFIFTRVRTKINGKYTKKHQSRTFRLNENELELFGITNYRRLVSSLVLKNAIRNKHRIVDNKPTGIVSYGINDKPTEVKYISF